MEDQVQQEFGRNPETFFADVEIAPPIEVFSLTAQYNQDPHPNKVNLGVGGTKRWPMQMSNFEQIK